MMSGDEYHTSREREQRLLDRERDLLDREREAVAQDEQFPFGWLQPLREAVSEVEYKNWRFNVQVDDAVPYLQITFRDAFADPPTQYCRKWLLYRTMNRSEVIRTAWMAVMAAEEHEARERFTFRGRRIMNPHLDVDQLVEHFASVSSIAVTDDPS